MIIEKFSELDSLISYLKNEENDNSDEENKNLIDNKESEVNYSNDINEIDSENNISNSESEILK